MIARNFAFGGNFSEWVNFNVKRGVTPEQAMNYSLHYGTQPWWGKLAKRHVHSIGEWLEAYGLSADHQFYGDFNGAAEALETIIGWIDEGYTSGQVNAWRAIGLRPEQVEDKGKAVVIILD